MSNYNVYGRNEISNSWRKRDKMIDKPHVLYIFPNSLNKFNKTRPLV